MLLYKFLNRETIPFVILISLILFYKRDPYVPVLLLHHMKSSALSNHGAVDDNPETREKFALFYCYKLRTCTPGGDKVCGYDDSQTSLAEFEDLCTLYTVNCEKRGRCKLESCMRRAHVAMDMKIVYFMK
ncbi:unnamed protein product [Euphydryas editha]|uniref:Uncharacterized protein n=1 Tax=Euphydryas editha TaxID=104508 RepID=A0AAU9U836_EUPED|nr:unnamed protein product [Euphydryas editha]